MKEGCRKALFGVLEGNWGQQRQGGQQTATERGIQTRADCNTGRQAATETGKVGRWQTAETWKVADNRDGEGGTDNRDREGDRQQRQGRWQTTEAGKVTDNRDREGGRQQRH